MALTEVYVDPSIAADSGSGTVGDPYGDLEYAIEQTTFDTTNGTRVNIKAGTDEVLAAELSLALEDTVTTVAWAPTASAPCIFQGYTSTAGDGGIGGISGGGSVAIYDEASGKDYISFIDLHLHNVGANYILNLDDYCNVINCDLDNGTGTAAIDVSIWSTVHLCRITNFSGRGIIAAERCDVTYNFLKNGASNKFNAAIEHAGPGLCSRNIISVDSTSDGIYCRETVVEHNSIYSNAGTGQGIQPQLNTWGVIRNNLVEGFSGAGGVGISFSVATTYSCRDFSGNSVYNCNTDLDSPRYSLITSGNESLSATPFTDAANDDFSPVDTGSVKEGAIPQAFNDS